VPANDEYDSLTADAARSWPTVAPVAAAAAAAAVVAVAGAAVPTATSAAVLSLSKPPSYDAV
jgi:hypothetical protein